MEMGGTILENLQSSSNLQFPKGEQRTSVKSFRPAQKILTIKGEGGTLNLLNVANEGLF